MPSHRLAVAVLFVGFGAAALATEKPAPAPQKPAAPAMKWEYKVLKADEIATLGNKDFVAGLNKLGDEGWELVATPTGSPTQGGADATWGNFYFKRQKTRAAADEGKGPPAKVETKSEDYQVLKLKNIAAADFAKTAEALFGGKADGGPHLVAEPLTNSVLVQGTAKQLDDLHRLASVLDVPDAAAGPAEAVMRAEILHLKYAKVTDVLKVLQELYGKDLKNCRMSADERTNSLILYGMEKALVEVAALVNQLDVQADKDVPDRKKP